MGLTRKGESTESTLVYENEAEGDHEARLVYVADLGLQTREYKGEVKPNAQQIALCLEILGSTVTLDGEEVPRIMWTKPFNIFGKMDSKSNEYQMYKAFVPTAKEGEYADWDNALGKACNAVVVHVKDKQDPSKIYDNIDSISSIPSKYLDQVPEGQITDCCVGDSEDEESPAIKRLFGLAKFVHAKRVLEGEEGSDAPSSPQQASRPPVIEVAQAAGFDDDIPFSKVAA